jgi:hypothetical protein
MAIAMGKGAAQLQLVRQESGPTNKFASPDFSLVQNKPSAKNGNVIAPYRVRAKFTCNKRVEMNLEEELNEKGFFLDCIPRRKAGEDGVVNGRNRGEHERHPSSR